MSPKCLHSTILRFFPSRFDNLSQRFTTGKEQILFLSSYTIETRVLKKKFSCFAQLRSDVSTMSPADQASTTPAKGFSPMMNGAAVTRNVEPDTNLTEKRRRKPCSYSKHGLVTLKHAVKGLGSRVIARRMTLGKSLAKWRADLIEDLGGTDEISTQRSALIDLAVKSKLLLDSIDAWPANSTEPG